MAYIYPNRSSFGRQPWRLQRGLVFGVILVAALAAFELFNFATTEYALYTLIGGVQAVGVNWASILAVAFCAIDFAGLARLFTPEQGRDEPKEVWYLLGAWLVGATMNAAMTWWAVTNALLARPLGNEVIARGTLVTVVPIFVAVLVWLTRVLIIGTVGVAGDRLFTLGVGHARWFGRAQPKAQAPLAAPRPAPRPISRPNRVSQTRTSTWPPYNNAARYASSVGSAAPSVSVDDRDDANDAEEQDEELTYEPVDEERPTAVPNWPGASSTRPAPKPRPSYSNAYAMRAYSGAIQSYVERPATPRTYHASPDGKPDDTRTRFYR
ncbi:MAG: hypothetical protein M5R40_10650 [Anaerolineae bacterium]|nr:hypothetical protein [Anaerolineae bacterium]